MISGLNLPYVIIDLGQRERTVGTTYVAVSRATSFKGLAFDGSGDNKMPSYDRFTRYYNYEDFKAVKKEDERLDDLAKKTMEAYQMETLMNEVAQDMELEQVNEEEEEEMEVDES